MNRLCFFLSMLAAYYLYSYFIVEYCSMRVVFFWFLMTIAVALATFVINKVKNKKFFSKIYIAAAVIFAAVDIVFVQGFDIIAMIMETTLLLLMIAFVKKNEKCHN